MLACTPRQPCAFQVTRSEECLLTKAQMLSAVACSRGNVQRMVTLKRGFIKSWYYLAGNFKLSLVTNACLSPLSVLCGA